MLRENSQGGGELLFVFTIKKITDSFFYRKGENLRRIKTGSILSVSVSPQLEGNFSLNKSISPLFYMGKCFGTALLKLYLFT